MIQDKYPKINKQGKGTNSNVLKNISPRGKYELKIDLIHYN